MDELLKSCQIDGAVLAKVERKTRKKKGRGQRLLVAEGDLCSAEKARVSFVNKKAEKKKGV